MIISFDKKITAEQLIEIKKLVSNYIVAIDESRVLINQGKDFSFYHTFFYIRNIADITRKPIHIIFPESTKLFRVNGDYYSFRNIAGDDKGFKEWILFKSPLDFFTYLDAESEKDLSKELEEKKLLMREEDYKKDFIESVISEHL